MVLVSTTERVFGTQRLSGTFNCSHFVLLSQDLCGRGKCAFSDRAPRGIAAFELDRTPAAPFAAFPSQNRATRVHLGFARFDNRSGHDFWLR
jgi:hypothetical protein